jgi:hypothetical protein
MRIKPVSQQPLCCYRRNGFSGRAIFVAIIIVILGGCQEGQPGSLVEQSTSAVSRPVSGPSHDLSRDEAAGGHTLKKHVGRTDDQLRDRLERERNISAASTYTDRETAERVVGTALQQEQARIQRWLGRPNGHPNLVLDYDGDPAHPIGRTLRRGEDRTEPCSHAVLVLKFDPPAGYHVLTTYPECR